LEGFAYISLTFKVTKCGKKGREGSHGGHYVCVFKKEKGQVNGGELLRETGVILLGPVSKVNGVKESPVAVAGGINGQWFDPGRRSNLNDNLSESQGNGL